MIYLISITAVIAITATAYTFILLAKRRNFVSIVFLIPYIAVAGLWAQSCIRSMFSGKTQERIEFGERLDIISPTLEDTAAIVMSSRVTFGASSFAGGLVPSDSIPSLGEILEKNNIKHQNGMAMVSQPSHSSRMKPPGP